MGGRNDPFSPTRLQGGAAVPSSGVGEAELRLFRAQAPCPDPKGHSSCSWGCWQSPGCEHKAKIDQKSGFNLCHFLCNSSSAAGQGGRNRKQFAECVSAGSGGDREFYWALSASLNFSRGKSVSQIEPRSSSALPALHSGDQVLQIKNDWLIKKGWLIKEKTNH